MHDRRAKPEFTVIIPTFNRADSLAKVLSAWGKQIPADLEFEVVIVDDGSRDQTPRVLASQQPDRFTLVPLRQENTGPAAARNHGMAAAGGRWILFTGDDIEPAPDLLANHLEAHRALNDERWAVLGNVAWPRELDPTSTMNYVDGVGAQQFSYHYMEDGTEYDYRHFYTSNVSVSRRFLGEEFGGFSDAFSDAAFEDAEFSYRMSLRGMRIAYRACARAWHHHPYDVAAFFKRQVVCGRMAAVLIRKWPKTGRIIGANAVTRSRVRERLTIGSRRRRIDEVERNFEHLERGVIEYAARYDSPSDSAVYPLLETVFRYGFLKGLATAWLSERAAKRMSAYWLANLVNDGIGRFGDELERRGRRPEIRRLTELLDVRLV